MAVVKALGACIGILGLISSVAHAQGEDEDPCRFRRDCRISGGETSDGFRSFERAVTKIKKTPFKGDKTALRHSVSVSCNDVVPQVLTELVQDGGPGFFIDKKRGYVLTATFTGETGVNTTTPVVVPLATFSREPGTETSELNCLKTIFPYLHRDAKVYVQYEVRRTKDDKLSPELVAGAQIFAGLLGLFVGPTLGSGFSRIVERAATVSTTLKDNETLYNKFIDGFDMVRTVKSTAALTPADGALILDIGSGANITIERAPVESPLLDKTADGKRVATTQDVRDQLATWYKIDFAKVFENLQANVKDQLSNDDAKIVQGACQAVQNAAGAVPGLLAEEKLIVLVTYMRQFGLPPTPKSNCLYADQLTMAKAISLSLPFETSAPKPQVKDPDVKFQQETRPFLTNFFIAWQLAHRAAKAGDTAQGSDILVEFLGDRVSVKRDDSLTAFGQNELASSDSAAVLLLKSPALNKYGCYRRSTDELATIGYSAEVIAAFGDKDKPTLANVAVGLKNTDNGTTLKTIYIEPAPRSVRETIKQRFKDGCATGWKPFE